MKMREYANNTSTATTIYEFDIYDYICVEHLNKWNKATFLQFLRKFKKSFIFEMPYCACY